MIDSRPQRLLEYAAALGKSVCDAAIDGGDYKTGEEPAMVALNLFSSDAADGERLLIKKLAELCKEDGAPLDNEDVLDLMADAWFEAYDKQLEVRGGAPT